MYDRNVWFEEEIVGYVGNLGVPYVISFYCYLIYSITGMLENKQS